jgi:hypothetical protein
MTVVAGSRRADGNPGTCSRRSGRLRPLHLLFALARSTGRRPARRAGAARGSRPGSEHAGHRDGERRAALPQGPRQGHGQEAGAGQRPGAAGEDHGGPESDGQRRGVHSQAEGASPAHTAKASAAQNSAMPSTADPHGQGWTNSSRTRWTECRKPPGCRASRLAVEPVPVPFGGPETGSTPGHRDAATTPACGIPQPGSVSPPMGASTSPE